MSIRETYLKDYGISAEQQKDIEKRCREARGRDQILLLRAAQEVYPAIAKYLFMSLTTGKGYDRISRLEEIPISRNDFYGYRRKTIETFFRNYVFEGENIQ